MCIRDSYDIMAAVMVGGMVPPIAIALAATFMKKKFTKAERKSAPVNYIMGLSFITEGAIPYAAADPLRVIPSCVVGSAVAGGLSMLFNCTLMAPHGGIFVFAVVGNWPLYIVSVSYTHLIKYFEMLVQRLCGHTEKCIVSFLDNYRSINKNMKALNVSDISDSEKYGLIGRMAQTAKRYGIYRCV